jgi:hypothetical protein
MKITIYGWSTSRSACVAARSGREAGGVKHLERGR